MLFNSLQFVFFFIIVSLLYYTLRHRGRIWLLLLASCYFYMAFKPVYIFILLFTILVDYFAGIWIARAEGKKRKWLLILSLITNIGFLAIFKYFNFINQNLNIVFGLFGMENPVPNYPLELPIGLSFHTFQAMSYTIEVYRKNQKPEKDFIIYSLYVMFYPQLVAGPIERPQNLLWQFHTYFKYNFENIKAGLIRIAWGLFMKVVIADRLAMVVDYSYNDPVSHNGLTLLLATFFFTFQIYCDFAGYSSIAIGCARIMGFNLMENFNAPYFSKSISEFWRRWHISLSTWFKDYLYIPLGGNRVSEWRLYFNYFLVFTVSGLWHGAAWTYVIWGALHGVYLIAAMVLKKYFSFGKKEDKLDVQPKGYGIQLIVAKYFNIAFTFVLVMFTWIFFRARGLSNAKVIIQKITELRFSDSIATPFSSNEMVFCWVLILVLLFKDKYARIISSENTPLFYIKFIGLMIACYFLGVFTSNQFIYFQF
ncbi:MAG: alginate O-acetyltransferase complex protein AlgI [Spirosomataceae bacterium]|jgi:alginate O-acetyltransferase complex protein AlgI